MNRSTLQKWIAILEEIIQRIGGDMGQVIRQAGELRLTERRSEIAAFLAYAGSLHGARLTETDKPSAFGELSNWLAKRHGRPTFVVDALAGAELTCSSARNPEAFWYQKLVALHALASYAALSGDGSAIAAMQRAARAVHDEIQPDHATAMPWAIHAFVLAEGCDPTAEWVLNACMVQSGGEPRGAALVMLAESLYCLRYVADRPGREEA